MDIFKERLRIALSNANMRQVDLANKLGVARSTMSEYMSGKCKPKQSMLYDMSKILGVSPSWLLGFDEPVAVPSNLEIIMKRINTLNNNQIDILLKIIDVLFPDDEQDK